MAANYSISKAPRCCGEMLTFGTVTCDCIICGKTYPTEPILDYFYTEVLPTLSVEDGLRVKRILNRRFS